MRSIGSLVNSVAHDLGLHISRYDRNSGQFPKFVEAEFVQLYERHRANTMVHWSGLYTAYKAARYVAQNGVPGEIVECGVWKGGCSILIAETLRKYGVEDKKVYMYDTYAGPSEPTSADILMSSNAPAKQKYESQKRNDHVDWMYSPVEEVRRNVNAANYPGENFELVEGDVQETIPSVAPADIALLRLDTDWYESTYHELEHLYPRLVVGGVIIADDYNWWEGATKAVDAYFEQQDVGIWLQVDSAYGAVAGIKQAPGS